MTNVQLGSVNRRSARRLARRLGWLSTIAILAASLALQDILHGEADLTLEWTVLRISFLVIVAFHAVALFALRRPMRDLEDQREQHEGRDEVHEEVGRSLDE